MQYEISIIIPVYNEEYSIERTIAKIKEVVGKLNIVYEIIVINDGSTDNSKYILDKIKDIRLINYNCNRGYGASLKTGLDNARYNLILITDADNTYPLEDIPKLIKKIEGYDMVIGIRSNLENISISRKIAKKIITCLANYLSRKNIYDINSGFRIFKKDIALKYKNLYPDGFSFTTTITMAFLTSGYGIGYIPIKYFQRKGKSKIKPFKDFMGFIYLILKVMTYFNPLRMFSLISFVMFLTGVIVLVYSLFFLERVLDITVTIILLISIQVFLYGLLADLILNERIKKW